AARRAWVDLRQRRGAAAPAADDRPPGGAGRPARRGHPADGQQVGGEAADFAPHVKGLELPGYEPRTLQTMALGFAVGSRGADHNRSGAYEVDFSPRANRLNGSASSARLAVE